MDSGFRWPDGYAHTPALKIWRVRSCSIPLPYREATSGKVGGFASPARRGKKRFLRNFYLEAPVDVGIVA